MYMCMHSMYVLYEYVLYVYADNIHTSYYLCVEIVVLGSA